MDEAERRRFEAIEHIETRYRQERCVDCGNRSWWSALLWSRCVACRSLVCRTCRSNATYPWTDYWRSPGCGAGRDETGMWHAGLYRGVGAGAIALHYEGNSGVELDDVRGDEERLRPPWKG